MLKSPLNTASDVKKARHRSRPLVGLPAALEAASKAAAVPRRRGRLCGVC